MTTPAHPGRMLFVNMPVADLECCGCPAFMKTSHNSRSGGRGAIQGGGDGRFAETGTPYLAVRLRR